jgi:tight adherence protein C
MDTIVLLGAGLSSVAVAATFLGVRAMVTVPRDAVLDRVVRVTRIAVADQSLPLPTKETSLWVALLGSLSNLARPEEGDEISRTKTRLMHAGVRREHAVEIFYGSKIALSVALAGGLLLVSAIGAAPIPHAHMLAVVLAAAGFYSPNVWLRSQVKARQSALGRSLPDTLDLLVTCVEAGLGLDAALGRITDELGLSAPELASEFRHTTMQIQAGVARADAFRRLAERTGLEELRSLSAMVIQTEMFGTGIARALRVHSSSMRTRRTHRAEEEAATVAVKMMVPLILCILPSLFAVILGPAVVRIIELLMPTMSGGH